MNETINPRVVASRLVAADGEIRELKAEVACLAEAVASLRRQLVEVRNHIWAHVEDDPDG